MKIQVTLMKLTNILKMLMRKKIVNLVIVVIIAIISFTLGRITEWSLFILDKNISLVDILSIIVNVCLAIYIAKILEREVQNSQNGKQIFI